MIGRLPDTGLIMQQMTSGLDGLEQRNSADLENDPQAVQRACREFESFFIYYLLKVMRQTVPKVHLCDGGQGEEMYQSLMDQEMSRMLAASGGIGLAELLLERIRPESSESNENVSMKQNGLSVGENPSFVYPLQGELSSPFGMRLDPITGSPAIHKGIDLAAKEGAAVRASAPGSVIQSGEARGYGNYVAIAHPDGYTTLYAHLKERNVNGGDEVEAGRIIGRVGSTGRATGPHLHFEVRKDDRHIDPELILSNKLARSSIEAPDV